MSHPTPSTSLCTTVNQLRPRIAGTFTHYLHPIFRFVFSRQLFILSFHIFKVDKLDAVEEIFGHIGMGDGRLASKVLSSTLKGNNPRIICQRPSNGRLQTPKNPQDIWKFVLKILKILNY